MASIDWLRRDALTPRDARRHAPRGVTTEHPVMSMGSALVAQSSFSRVIGNSVTLLPRAFKTAFAMAAGTPTKTSPASPFTPSKWLAERRIEANQEFHSAALTLADTAREGIRERNRRKVLDSIPKLNAVLLRPKLRPPE